MSELYRNVSGTLQSSCSLRCSHGFGNFLRWFRIQGLPSAFLFTSSVVFEAETNFWLHFMLFPSLCSDLNVIFSTFCSKFLDSFFVVCHSPFSMVCCFSFANCNFRFFLRFQISLRCLELLCGHLHQTAIFPKNRVNYIICYETNDLI